MEEVIDDIIKNAFREIEYHVRKLQYVTPEELKLFHYAFPRISVKKLEPVADGRKIAEIEVDITKYKAEYPQETASGTKEYIQIKTPEQFMERSIKSVLYSPDFNAVQKAFVLQEFKENIEQNYMKRDQKRTKKIIDIIVELYEKIMNSAKGDTDTFFSLDASNTVWEKQDPELQKAKKIKVLNLVNRLLDPKVYAQIQEHEKQGRFYRGEPCRIRMIRTVVWE